MTSLSTLLDKPIRAPDGQELARLQDVIVRVALPPSADVPASDAYPPVAGITTTGLEPERDEKASSSGDTGSDDGEHCFIPWSQVGYLGADGSRLTTVDSAFREWKPRDGELALRGDLLDRNVLDLGAKRIVRVNDVVLDERDGALRVVGVDAGAGAILRRLGIGGLSQRVLGRLARGEKQQPAVVDWARIVLIGDASESGVRRGPWWHSQLARLARLDPSELADLAEHLTPRQAAVLLSALDAAHAADTLEEMEDQHQAHVLRAMDPEHAADVLEEMEPDEAADALQSLHDVDDEQAADLLSRMDRDDAEDVEELVAYPANTAGGLMTTDYVAVSGGVTAGQVLDALRSRARAAESGQAEPVPEALQEIYVVEPRETAPAGRDQAAASGEAAASLPLETEGRLIGVVAMRDLVLADPATSLLALMDTVEAVARPLDDARQVARVMAEEDLVALPVVDEDNILQGVVTIDDAVDVILPAAWRQRLPHRLK